MQECRYCMTMMRFLRRSSGSSLCCYIRFCSKESCWLYWISYKTKRKHKKIDLKDVVEDNTVYSYSESLDAVGIALAIAAEIGSIEVRGIVAILTKAIPIAVTLADGAYYIINEIM